MIYIGTFCHIGVLAVMWPCGIVNNLSKLYSSESKSLVYGYLHDFYTQMPANASEISKQSLFVCSQ